MRQLFNSTITQSVDHCERWTVIALSLVFILSTNIVFGQTKLKNDWMDMKLKRKIKTIKESDFGVKQEILETYGEIQPSVIIASRTYSFNSDGNVAEYISYWANGDINRKSIYKFDSLGYAIEYSCYNKKDILVNKTTFEYNSTLRIEEEKEYTDKGILKERKVRNYDANGNCIETTIFNPDGKIESKYSSIYNGDGNIIEATEYNKKGKELFKSTFRYDGNKNLVEKTVSTPNGEVVGQIVYYYTFDFYGNWIQKITIRMDLSANTSYNIDDPRYITKREIEYF